ncbi:hypothetical protein [Bradyrhizobium oligotrophicum]|uniref:hypothetical protein n=1 Tax=Bradyrhizobium oligotrophicum TaxID=44255 RepID=UPI003EBFAF72
MTPGDAIERMIKLAMSRHTDGIPDHLICFDKEGNEIEWTTVLAESPKDKVGDREVVTPTPGVGYFCHIILNGSHTTMAEERITFTVRTPTFEHKADYVQPRAGAGYFVQPPPNADDETTASLLAIGRKL